MTPFPKGENPPQHFTLSDCARLASGCDDRTSRDYGDWYRHFRDAAESCALPAARVDRQGRQRPLLASGKTLVNSPTSDSTIYSIERENLRAYLQSSAMSEHVNGALRSALGIEARPAPAPQAVDAITKRAFVAKHGGKGSAVANAFKNHPDAVRGCALDGRGNYSESCLVRTLQAVGIALRITPSLTVVSETPKKATAKAA